MGRPGLQLRISKPQKVISPFVIFDTRANRELAQQIEQAFEATSVLWERAGAWGCLETFTANRILSSPSRYLDTFSWSALMDWCRDEDAGGVRLRDRLEYLNRSAPTVPKDGISINWLISQHVNLCPDIRHDFRAGPMYVRPDRFGQVEQFVAPEAVSAALQCIVTFFNEKKAHAPILNALWVMAAFLNCHPFVDGNGRMARTLFVVKSMQGSGGAYLPLHALALGAPNFFRCCVKAFILHENAEMILRFLRSGLQFLTAELKRHCGSQALDT